MSRASKEGVRTDVWIVCGESAVWRECGETAMWKIWFVEGIFFYSDS